ncbi:MAG: hypothetical protein K9J16_17035 [Melioribacteraceae bacterium]|nr:hypothetical protein [Melioribacteraceae bacterium]MCF8356118.1 hypothetical protein [Melioribacteraceae bacterium]MCF8395900.1 hypothetical protein [Melioribacteraceae bacterium]MCF8420994.1 hypothetical protein [Melioribacteraceae bacterium]
MDEENKIKQPIYMVFLTLIIMVGLSYIPQDFSFAGYEVKEVDVLSDLKEENLDDLYEEYYEDYYEKYDEYEDYEYVPDAGTDQDSSGETNQDDQSYNVELKNNVLKASLFEGLTLIFSGEEAASDNTKGGVIPKTKRVPLTGDLNQMKYFFDSLKKTKSSRVRIAHYGDSAIEGDLVTADIRSVLQEKFGGRGAGFLSMTSKDIAFRKTTQHSFSDNWEDYGVFSKNPKKLPVGINGEVFVPGRKSWAKYETSRYYRDLKFFKEVRLFYSEAKGSSVTFTFDDKDKKIERLQTGSGIKELFVKADRDVKSVNIEIPNEEQAYFYGVSLEDGNGVYIDNFPLRGNSGVSLKNVPLESFRDFNKMLDYKLIILEFGLNALGNSKRDYSWYEREMKDVIEHLRKAFPKTSMVLISVHDKSIRRGTDFVTDPEVLKLLKAQEAIAHDNGIAFWNLHAAMGGINSMPDWVSSSPPLAFKDYIHFNDQGAKLVAEMFVDALMRAYEK